MSCRGREPSEIRVAKARMRCASIGRAQSWGNTFARVVVVALEVQRAPNIYVRFSSTLRLGHWAKGVRKQLACASECDGISRRRGGVIFTPRNISTSRSSCFIYLFYTSTVFFLPERLGRVESGLSKAVAIGQRFRVRSFYLDVINLLDIAARVSTAYFLSRPRFSRALGPSAVGGTTTWRNWVVTREGTAADQFVPWSVRVGGEAVCDAAMVISLAVYRTFLSVRALVAMVGVGCWMQGVVGRAPGLLRSLDFVCAVNPCLSARWYSVCGAYTILLFMSKHPVDRARFAKRTPTSTERLVLASSP